MEAELERQAASFRDRLTARIRIEEERRIETENQLKTLRSEVSLFPLSPYFFLYFPIPNLLLFFLIGGVPSKTTGRGPFRGNVPSFHRQQLFKLE